MAGFGKGSSIAILLTATVMIMSFSCCCTFQDSVTLSPANFTEHKLELLHCTDSVEVAALIQQALPDSCLTDAVFRGSLQPWTQRVKSAEALVRAVGYLSPPEHVPRMIPLT